jgi:hypothetical protein
MADGDALILGSGGNSETTTTEVTKNQFFLPVLDLINDHGVALLAIGGNDEGPAGEGVSASSPSYGVYSDGGQAGVLGFGPIGVDGATVGGIGVRGAATGGNDNIAGVQGKSTSGAGVWAESDTGVGAYCNSNETAAVYGYSLNSLGVYGTSTNGSAVAGFAQAGGSGVVGSSQSGFAGQFNGPVFISGDLTVLGVKSAAVTLPDGSLRGLFAIESPASIFEDFGEAELQAGQAYVRLSEDFAAAIGEVRHVFLTAEGDCRGLYVSQKSEAGFEVREMQGGSSNVRFSYRVIGSRKDVSRERMPTLPRPSDPGHPDPPSAQPTNAPAERLDQSRLR